MDKKAAKKPAADLRVALRLRQEDLERLDSVVARMQKKASWTKVTRTDAIRAAIDEFYNKEGV